MGSLSLAACHYRGQTSLTRPEALQSLQLTPLEITLKLVHFLPMTWRKWLLDVSRIQSDPSRNIGLQKGFDALDPSEVVIVAQREPYYTVSKWEIRDLVMNFYDSELACGILSYFVRAETTAVPDEFMEVFEQTVTKEIKAALWFNPHTTNMDYNALFGEGDSPLTTLTQSGGQQRVYQLLQQNLKSFRSIHSRSTAPILFPIFSDKKNVSTSTQEAYKRALYGDDAMEINEDEETQVTTLSLLRHYHETGEQIMGPVEVRVSWKYGELKPRVYYCNGGESYWCSLWVKPIVNHLLTALPSTNPSSRYQVQRLGTLEADKILVTYDYTSFTTSLSELKFYMHHLANALTGTTIVCLDVFKGPIEVDVGDYLHTYNRIANLHQVFDLRRILPRSAEETMFRQGRSGSLGVQGNIGFSTSLHGAALGCFTSKPVEESVVGDDALTEIFSVILDSFIAHTNHLGEIHPEKFTTFSRPPEDNPGFAEEQQYKYLKRPITVDFVGKIQTGCLDFFPSIADFLFPDGDGIHTPSMSSDPTIRTRSLCNQWGRYLNLQHRSESLDRTSDTDLGLILDLMGMCYDKVGLPKEGGVPGLMYYPRGDKGEATAATFFVPPCDSIEVFNYNWVEALYSTHQGVLITEPLRVGGTIPMDPYAVCGSRMRASDGDQLLKLMVGLGYASRDPVVVEVPFDNLYVARFERILAGEGGEILYDVNILRELPDWYLFVAQKRLYDLEPVDVNKKLVEIQSITGSFHE